MKTTLDVNSNEYRTSDLGCSSALIAWDFQLVSLDRTTPNRVVFVFDKSPEIEEAVAAYWSGRLIVKAKTYFETQKWLKSRVYNG